MENRMYKVKEFSERYGLSLKAIYDHIADGTLPAHKICGVYYINEAEMLDSTVYDPEEA